MKLPYYKDLLESPVAIASVDDLPGCTQVAVIHSSFVLPEKRGQGIGREAHLERLRIIQDWLYNYALCTVDRNNEPEIKILESAKWKRLDEFVSTKTGHIVCLYGRKM